VATRESTLSDGIALVATSVLTAMAGSWGLSKLRVSLPAKTILALGVGVGGGIFVARYHKPIGWGLATGLGGIGLMALVAQFAGAIDAGTAFGFEKRPRLESLRGLEEVPTDEWPLREAAPRRRIA